jgi:hypothetical protein
MARTHYINNKPQPRVYRVILNQGGGATPPTETILENSLEFVPVWSYAGPGIYVLESIGNFPAGRTFIMMPYVSVDLVTNVLTPGDSVAIVNQAGIDGLVDVNFEVLVYPPAI